MHNGLEPLRTSKIKLLQSKIHYNSFPIYFKIFHLQFICMCIDILEQVMENAHAACEVSLVH